MSEMKKVCLDPGHDAGNLANKSPDGTYYEHEFCLDMGKRIQALLERHGVAVTMTRTDGKEVSLAKRCEIANGIPGPLPPDGASIFMVQEATVKRQPRIFWQQ